MDLTVPIDDILCERFHACLRCGQRSKWLDVRVLENQGYFVCLCDRCYRTEGWEPLDLVLWARAHALQHATRARKD